MVLGLGVLRLDLRTDGATLYPVGDPVVERARADRTAFYESEQVVLLIQPKPDAPGLTEIAGLRTLKSIHNDVARLRGVDARRLRSLASMLDPSPGLTPLEIPDFLETIPEDENELADLLQRIADSPLGHGLYLAPDGQAAAVYVRLDAGDERGAFLARLETWAEHEAPEQVDVQLTGPVVAEVSLGRVVVEDLARLVPIVVLVVAILLFFALKSVGSVLVTMAEVGVVLVWTLGAMGWTGTPITLMTTILPVVLLAMGVTDEIHLLDRLRAHLNHGATRYATMEAALKDVARPIALTSLTTAAGLLSFTTTSTMPLRHFGIFAAFGVVAAMFLSFTLVPALVVALPKRLFATREHGGMPTGGQALPFFGAWSALVGAALFALAVPGVFQLEARDSWIRNLERNSPVVVATHAFDETFWGSYRYDVVLSTDEAMFFQFNDGLRLVEELTEILRRAPHVGGSLSHLVAHEIHANVDEEPLPVSGLPRETVRRFAGNLQKMQRRIDLDQYVRGDGRSARIRLFVRDADYVRTSELEAFLLREIPPALEDTGVRFHGSGDLAAAQAVVRSVVVNVVRSTAWTLFGVLVILAFALQSLAWAVVCLVPLISGISILLGIMGYLGVPLGIATGMFVAVALGVGVDFGLYAFHAYERARTAGAEHREALATMLARAGRSIGWNAIVLAAGFSVLGFSALPPNRSLGMLLAGAIALCCGMTLLLLPSLFRIAVHRHRPTL